jgi:hypothetical protein
MWFIFCRDKGNTFNFRVALEYLTSCGVRPRFFVLPFNFFTTVARLLTSGLCWIFYVVRGAIFFFLRNLLPFPILAHVVNFLSRQGQHFPLPGGAGIFDVVRRAARVFRFPGPSLSDPRTFSFIFLRQWQHFCIPGCGEYFVPPGPFFSDPRTWLHSMCAHDGDLFSPTRDLFVCSAETSGSSPRRCDSHTRKVSFLPSTYLKSKEPGKRKDPEVNEPGD